MYNPLEVVENKWVPGLTMPYKPINEVMGPLLITVFFVPPCIHFAHIFRVVNRCCALNQRIRDRGLCTDDAAEGDGGHTGCCRGGSRKTS